jgi:hypothetical protein
MPLGAVEKNRRFFRRDELLAHDPLKHLLKALSFGIYNQVRCLSQITSRKPRERNDCSTIHGLAKG